MNLIDIDRLKVIENHIHYIKMYEGSAVLIDLKSKVFRFNIKFTIEHRPVGTPIVKVNFLEHPHFPVIDLVKKVKKKVYEMDDKGVLSALNQ